MSLYKELKRLTHDIKSGKLDISSCHKYKLVQYSQDVLIKFESKPSDYTKGLGCCVYVRYKSNHPLWIWCDKEFQISIEERDLPKKIFQKVYLNEDEALNVLEEFDKKEQEVLAFYDGSLIAFCEKFINLAEETNYKQYKQYIEEEYKMIHNTEVKKC